MNKDQIKSRVLRMYNENTLDSYKELAQKLNDAAIPRRIQSGVRQWDYKSLSKYLIDNGVRQKHLGPRVNKKKVVQGDVLIKAIRQVLDSNMSDEVKRMVLKNIAKEL